MTIYFRFLQHVQKSSLLPEYHQSAQQRVRAIVNTLIKNMFENSENYIKESCAEQEINLNLFLK